MCQAVKDCLWAFATLNHVPPDIFLSTSEQHCIATLGDFTSQNVANAMWAFQKLGHSPTQQLLHMVDDQVRICDDGADPILAEAQSLHGVTVAKVMCPTQQLLHMVGDQV